MSKNSLKYFRDYLFSDKQIKMLHRLIINLNNEVVAKRENPTYEEMSMSDDLAKQFMVQYLSGKGELLEQVNRLNDGSNRVAQQILACALNIKLDLTLQQSSGHAESKEPPQIYN